MAPRAIADPMSAVVRGRISLAMALGSAEGEEPRFKRRLNLGGAVGGVKRIPGPPTGSKMFSTRMPDVYVLWNNAPYGTSNVDKDAVPYLVIQLQLPHYLMALFAFPRVEKSTNSQYCGASFYPADAVQRVANSVWKSPGRSRLDHWPISSPMV